MENETGSPKNFRELVRWATTPPQIYAVYLVLLILVWATSFYAGTLSPRKTQTPLAPPVSAPQR
jgi:hypothetical protein